MRRILFAVFILCCLPTAAFAAKPPAPGDACGGGGANANGFPMGVTNGWNLTSGVANGGLANGMFCNGSTWTGVISFQSTGNVGIGTATPSEVLDVNGNIHLNTTANGSAGYLKLESVGYGNAYIQDVFGSLFISQNTYYDTAGHVNFERSYQPASEILVDHTSGGFQFLVAPPGGTGSIAWTNGMKITNSGKVGIGTTIPAALLDVAGEIRTTGNTLACSSTTTGAIRYNSSTKAFDYCGGATPAWTAFSASSSAAGSSGQVQFNSGGALAGASGLVYLSNGNVGIGTTTPGQNLQVGQGAASGTATNGIIRVGSMSGVGAFRQWDFGTSQSASPYNFYIQDTATCSGLHLSAGWLALVGLIWLTLVGIIDGTWLTLGDPRLMLGATGLHSSAPAHARWD